MPDIMFRLLATCFVGLAAGIYFFFKGFLWNREKRLIENMPTSKIRSIAMGPVEVWAKATVFEKLLKSPFTNTDCVFFEYKVQELKKQGKSSNWVAIKEDRSTDEFGVEDETGKTIVDPEGANVQIDEKIIFESGFNKDPPEQIIRALKGFGLSYEGFLGLNKKMRFTEKMIVPNQSLYIMGYAGDNPYVNEAHATKNEQDVMIRKQKDSEFIISDKSEKEIVSGLSTRSALGIFGGLGLVAGCLFFILELLNLL